MEIKIETRTARTVRTVSYTHLDVYKRQTMELAKADPDALPESEKNILTLAGARLLFATAEPHIYEAVTAVFSCAGTDFTARGKTVLAEGWKELQRRYRATLKDKPEAEDGENADVTLPKLSEGQGFPNPAAKVTEHTTTPPKPHSEASLLSAMERAGNGDTDPDAERRGLEMCIRDRPRRGCVHFYL